MFINYQTVGLKSGLFSLCVCFLSCWRSNTRFVIRLFFLMKKYFFLTFSYFKYFADQKFSCAVYFTGNNAIKTTTLPRSTNHSAPLQFTKAHHDVIMMSSWGRLTDGLFQNDLPAVRSDQLCNFQTDLLNFAEINADVTLEESQVVLYVYEERKQNGGLYFGKWSAAM